MFVSEIDGTSGGGVLAFPDITGTTINRVRQPQYPGGMSRVEQIEGEIRALNQDELKAFREWFLRFDADAWDEQIEADVKSGKLKALAQRALRDHQAGRSTVL